MRVKHQAPMEASCLGKDKFRSMALASEVASKTAKRRSKVITPYKCIYCGHYHVGQISGKGLADKRKVLNYEQP